MPSRAEKFREEIIASMSPLLGHSLNQKAIKFMREGEERAFGKRNKAVIAEKKRNDFSDNFSRKQFERSLRNVFNGGVTQENIVHIMKQIDKFEEQVEGSEGVEGVKITMVSLSKE